MFAGKYPVLLNELRIPSSLNVAVLAPHPDDFDAIGVTMRLFKDNGNRIDVGVVTSAASGVEDGFCQAFTTHAKGIIREKEQVASLRYFGLPQDRLSFLRLTEGDDGHPLDNTENLELVRSFVLAVRPDIMFMPHWNDTNIGHRRTYAFFSRIAQGEKWSGVACLIRDPKTITMRDDLYAVFDGETAAWKGELLRFHQSQHQRNLNTRGHGFDERILSVNRFTAETLAQNAEYAEAFEIEKYDPS